MRWRNATLLVLLLSLSFLAGCDVMANSKLEQAVVKALNDDARTKPFDFEVSAKDGDILVTGEVFTPADIDVVSEVIKKVPGVKSVQNNCKVPEESSGMMQDTVVPGVGGGLGF